MSDDNLARYPSLRGRAVLVSGGASGIGEAIVRGFARQGAKVGFADVMREQGEALAKELREQGAQAVFRECDLRDINALRGMASDIAGELGDIQALVNNAANDQRHKWEDVTPEFWDERQAVNLRHSFFMTQAVAPMMIRAGGGAIVNFGSSSWMLAQGGMPAYTSAKAATHGMTRSFARDLGGNGIRVNTVVPGWVMTARQREMWLTPEAERGMDEKMCLTGARVMPEDIANMVLFLCADDGKMCSAQNFIVDGGWL